MKTEWQLQASILVGGLTNVGFGADSDYLLVVSHNGRGVFALPSGDRVARDYEATGRWHRDIEADGIGPLDGQVVPIFGIHADLPPEIRSALEGFDLDSHVTEFKGAAISPDDQTLAVGYSDVIEIYKRT